MELLVVLILVVIAGICAAIAEFIVGFSPGGLLITVIIGVVGAYLGNALWEQIFTILPLPMLDVRVGTIYISLVWSVLGSALLLLLLSLLRGGRRRRILSPNGQTS